MTIAAFAIKRTIQYRATRKVLLKDSKTYGTSTASSRPP